MLGHHISDRGHAARAADEPTIDREGRIYFGSRDDRLYALDPKGKLLWQLAFPADIDAQVAITPEGTLVVACDDGHVRGLAAVDRTGANG